MTELEGNARVPHQWRTSTPMETCPKEVQSHSQDFNSAVLGPGPFFISASFLPLHFCVLPFHFVLGQLSHLFSIKMPPFLTRLPYNFHKKDNPSVSFLHLSTCLMSAVRTNLVIVCCTRHFSTSIVIGPSAFDGSPSTRHHLCDVDGSLPFEICMRWSILVKPRLWCSSISHPHRLPIACCRLFSEPSATSLVRAPPSCTRHHTSSTLTCCTCFAVVFCQAQPFFALATFPLHSDFHTHRSTTESRFNQTPYIFLFLPSVHSKYFLCPGSNDHRPTLLTGWLASIRSILNPCSS